MVKFYERKKLFDEDADWVPQKGKQFKMKTRPKEELQQEEPKEKPAPYEPPQEEPKEKTVPDEPPQEEPREKRKGKIKTDAEGMYRAYAQGDVYSKGNKEYVAGSHTYTDWFDDVTKNPQWQHFPSGFNDFSGFVDSEPGKYFFGTGDSRQSERYKKQRNILLLILR